MDKRKVEPPIILKNGNEIKALIIYIFPILQKGIDLKGKDN